MIETETTSKALQAYCDSDSRSIFIYEQEGDFVASQLAPQNSKSKKIVSFIKEDVPIQDAKVILSRTRCLLLTFVAGNEPEDSND